MLIKLCGFVAFSKRRHTIKTSPRPDFSRVTMVDSATFDSGRVRMGAAMRNRTGNC